MSDYGEPVGPQGKRHYPEFTRGCFYGPHPDRRGPCLRCQHGLVVATVVMIAKRVTGAVSRDIPREASQ